MKIIHVLFALYLSILVMYPCYDGCDEKSPTASSVTQSEHEETPDICSPFCISACCTFYSFSSGEFIFTPFSQDSDEDNTTYKIDTVPLIVIAIWQPPKIA